MLLLALAWKAYAQNQVAIPEVVTSQAEYTVLHNRGIPTGRTTHTVISLYFDGWTANPMAGLILVVLAALFVLNINLGPAWTRWRYWIAFPALLACLLPTLGQTRSLAIPTFILAVIAAVLNNSAAVAAA